jgi:hypothetical protein
MLIVLDYEKELQRQQQRQTSRGRARLARDEDAPHEAATKVIQARYFKRQKLSLRRVANIISSLKNPRNSRE